METLGEKKNKLNTRRKFLTILGIALPGTLIGQEKQLKRSRWDLIFGGGETTKPKIKPDPITWSDKAITAAWIGHSTVLINFYGTTIITDPVFSNRIGFNILGMTSIGPKRLVEPALRIEELPPIDLILLSHAHMDHLDLPSLEQFNRDIPIVISKNNVDIIDGLSTKEVHELDWGEKIFVRGVEIEAVQAKHFGWRMPWEGDRSRGNWYGRSYNAYLLRKNNKYIFFAGDTSIQEFFKAIGERGISVELAMMPIGAYDPWIQNHCNPEQAVAMADQIGAKHIFPMHWGTFIQSDEPTNEPLERFKKALAVTPERIALESHGQTWVLPEDSASF
jgi:L-ascorbate metabolism protein UlaG (beta-lactamase superfamily)